MFKKILIANRGEIAVRILRACRELGIRSVAVFSDVDRKSLHVRLADEAYPIGPAPSRESYLCIDKLMDVARRGGCDAVHPGYGFLAENAALPRACTDAGITFIGPPADAMESLGSKTAGRQLARRADVPSVPGTNDPIENPAEAQALAQRMSYPVLLKAVAGGGGKGMRLVHSTAEFESAFRDASSEAMNAFGDDRLYLEKYLDRPHHVEIQIFADAHGRVVSLGERECSVQRRHQKVIEEAPSPIVTPDLRKKMGDAAVRLARAGRYVNAGTVEFLVDANLNFYFLEVNTRLQVEHPVTEQVTGLDLVKLQIAIAAGHRLPFAWESITPRGHAMEVRLYAEDPDNDFFPSPGKILSRNVPSGPGIRLVSMKAGPCPTITTRFLASSSPGAIAVRKPLPAFVALSRSTPSSASRPTQVFSAASWMNPIFSVAKSTQGGWTTCCGVHVSRHLLLTIIGQEAPLLTPPPLPLRFGRPINQTDRPLSLRFSQTSPLDGSSRAAASNWTADREIRSPIRIGVRRRNSHDRTRTRSCRLARDAGWPDRRRRRRRDRSQHAFHFARRPILRNHSDAVPRR